MLLEDLAAGDAVVGLEPSSVVTVVAVVAIGDGALQVLYKTPEGVIKERLVGRADQGAIEIATVERPWAFDGDGEDFKLAVEAKRIDLAFLFDPMMAVHTSNVDALPHQITAVYESMLPRQPLRFVLADDPGAGKTIMAGLYILELLMRADARRVLIVAPGSLVEQWRDELFEKFGWSSGSFRESSRRLRLVAIRSKITITLSCDSIRCPGMKMLRTNCACPRVQRTHHELDRNRVRFRTTRRP